MIGIIARPEQRRVVEEFFELFKTPWEFYRSGRRYRVVISAGDDVPDVDAELLLVFASGANAPGSPRSGHGTQPRFITFGNVRLPIYGPLQTFSPQKNAAERLTADTGIVAFQTGAAGPRVIRIGYDIFAEVEFLLSAGQPADHAAIPTLDLHIRILREWIVDAGIALIEIPPTPAGHPFTVCLTHDIDFIGIRPHRFDATMWGFLYRSTVGSVATLLQRKLSLARCIRMWRAAASLPLVYLGWLRDFWEPFDWYLRAEHGLPATYYLIPFKHRRGERVAGAHAARRATKYDVTDLEQRVPTLLNAGCELGVHGIDAWHSDERGRDELARVATVTGASSTGIRMHWLMSDRDSASVLERAGYTYDSTSGYNETIGYRNGTSQVFRPLTARTLLELPLHIQDGALFYPERLGLSEGEATTRCRRLIDFTKSVGGVLTVLWHDRSHGPERFWGDFYLALIQDLKSSGAWFETAAHVVDWFRRRRAVRFRLAETTSPASVSVACDGDEIRPPLIVRVYRPGEGSGGAPAFVDTVWNGTNELHLNASGSGSGESMMLPVSVGVE